MVIGLNPEYNYPGTLEKWNTNNTFFAGNFGACLITRAIMRIFNADYVWDFSDLEAIRNNYDTCILALSTHVHEHRNVSYYADIVEKLNMKTVITSLGVQDYINSIADMEHIHPSVLRLLEIVSERSQWIGVRGPHTARILEKAGFSNVREIGCPTMHWHLDDRLSIRKKSAVENPLLLYQQTLLPSAEEIMRMVPFMGQDFLDQVVFTNELNDDQRLMQMQESNYAKAGCGAHTFDFIKKNGIFPKTFDEWFEIIGKHDFIFGPRIHGSIAALIQGIPAVLLVRDLRAKEIADFYSIPNASYDCLVNMDVHDLYMRANFDEFNNAHKKRHSNFYDFLESNELRHSLSRLGAQNCCESI